MPLDCPKSSVGKAFLQVLFKSYPFSGPCSREAFSGLQLKWSVPLPIIYALYFSYNLNLKLLENIEKQKNKGKINHIH